MRALDSSNVTRSVRDIFNSRSGNNELLSTMCHCVSSIVLRNNPYSRAVRTSAKICSSVLNQFWNFKIYQIAFFPLVNYFSHLGTAGKSFCLA